MNLTESRTVTLEERDWLLIEGVLRAAYDKARYEHDDNPKPGAREALNDLAICLDGVKS